MATATTTVTITVGNAFAQVTESTGDVPWTEVQEACSFSDSLLAKKLYPDLVKDLQTSATKQQSPPIRLFDAETKQFPVGLLGRVTTTLEEQGVTVIHKQQTVLPAASFNFKWQGTELWDHQKEIINTVQSSNRYGTIVAPTGSGKSKIIASLVQQLGVRTLIVVFGLDLVEQTANFMYEYLGIKAGQFCTGKAKLGTVTIAAAGASLKKCLKAMKLHCWTPGLLVVDEFHCITHNVLQDLNNINAYYRYGLSATPLRTGGDSLVLEAALGDVLAQVGINELQEKGLLAKVEVETVHIPQSEKIETGGATWEEVYRPAVVEHKGRNTRLRQAVKEKYEAGESILVDVDELDHMDHLDLQSAIPEEHIAEVTGQHSQKERSGIYAKFKRGEIKVLVGTVLKKGLDLPSASVVVLAGGKKSKVRLLQEIGRGLRAQKDKEYCTVIDTIDQQHYLTFQHCQERFRTMIAAGFKIPEDAIRTVQIETDLDSDEEIEKLRERQSLAKSKRMSKTRKEQDYECYRD